MHIFPDRTEEIKAGSVFDVQTITCSDLRIGKEIKIQPTTGTYFKNKTQIERKK